MKFFLFLGIVFCLFVFCTKRCESKSDDWECVGHIVKGECNCEISERILPGDGGARLFDAC